MKIPGIASQTYATLGIEGGARRLVTGEKNTCFLRDRQQDLGGVV